MKKIYTYILFFAFCTAMKAQTSGTLTVTSSIGASTFITAVWVTNSSSAFVRTLTAYGNETKYNKDLVKWTADCGGLRNYTNAVTGATKPSSSLITSTWNGTNQLNTTQVADGNYNVKIEMTTEGYGTGTKLVTGTFTKGPNAQTVTPTAVTPISAISIKWVPVNTALVDVELEKLYSVYPNPAISSIFISGLDINEVEICSLTGKSILFSKEQKIDISLLPSGIYLALIRTKVGTLVKKIYKR
ncbi:MAG: DUF2271 domain-containing protein [Paludibacter sp.]